MLSTKETRSCPRELPNSPSMRALQAPARYTKSHKIWIFGSDAQVTKSMQIFQNLKSSEL